MKKIVFKQSRLGKIVDIVMYAFGLAVVVFVAYFALQHFFGLEGVYGIKTVYLTAIIAAIVLVFMIRAVILDASLSIVVENGLLTITQSKKSESFIIDQVGFEFESTIYSGNSEHFMTIICSDGETKLFDISGLGQLQVEELKTLITANQTSTPNKIQTQQD